MALINCSECDAQISDKAASCPQCGNQQVQKVNCPECDSLMDNSSGSCGNCGFSKRATTSKSMSVTTLLLILVAVIGGSFLVIKKSQDHMAQSESDECWECKQILVKAGHSYENTHMKLPDSIHLLDLEQYTPDRTLPFCPSGGEYTLSVKRWVYPHEVVVTCSHHSHEEKKNSAN